MRAKIKKWFKLARAIKAKQCKTRATCTLNKIFHGITSTTSKLLFLQLLSPTENIPDSFVRMQTLG
jgi:hypothetical protein